MKLNKVKVARLTDEQARSVHGGGTNGSTKKNFTCCWCSSGEDTTVCNTVNFNEPECNTTKPDPSFTKPNDPSLVHP